MLSAIHDTDLHTLLVVLAVAAFVAAIYVAFVRQALEAAFVLALIGVLLLIFG